MYGAAFATWIGLTLANFAYAAIKNHDWGGAAKVTFFQAIALIAFLAAAAIH